MAFSIFTELFSSPQSISEPQKKTQNFSVLENIIVFHIHTHTQTHVIYVVCNIFVIFNALMTIFEKFCFNF